MARKPRIINEKGIYHVILRGNNKQNLFHDDLDRKFFLNRLYKYSKELKIDIYCYCLMTNHVHILIGKAGMNMSLLIQKIANSYVYYFNRKYERSGHLFQGRFKSESITDEVYFKTVYRYIMHNCEKAHLGSYSEYKWNSYHNQKNKKEQFINLDYVLSLFESQNALDSFLNLPATENCMEYENKIILSDTKAVQLILKLFGITTPYNFERLNIDDQKEKCHAMKEKGLSIAQISRITGICKSIIRSS